jgi:protein TonB
LSETDPDAIDQAQLKRHIPRLRREVKPQYTADAMRRRVQGEVELAAIVETNGSVRKVWLVRSLDADLDWQAAYAVRQWQFDPGTVDGRAVRCRVTVVLDFTLK